MCGKCANVSNPMRYGCCSDCHDADSQDTVRGSATVLARCRIFSERAKHKLFVFGSGQKIGEE